MVTALKAADRRKGRKGQDGDPSTLAADQGDRDENGPAEVDALSGQSGSGDDPKDSSDERALVEPPEVSPPIPRAPFATGSNVTLYKEGMSIYHAEELAAFLRRRAGIIPWPEKATGARKERMRDSFGGISQNTHVGDAPGMPAGGHRFQFETKGFEFGRLQEDGVPIGPADGSDEDLGDMNGQIHRSWTQARTQGSGQLRHFLDAGRGGLHL